jgi:hypothetical protein
MSGLPPIARLDLLAESLASGFLRQYEVERPPVPIFDMVRQPPEGLERHLSLCLALPYSDAIYLRLLNGQGTIFVNPRLAGPLQRFATAKALLMGLFNTPGGQALGLGIMSLELPGETAEYFARCLLMPASLMPKDWRALPVTELARIFDVPREVAATRLKELNGNGRLESGLSSTD